MSSVDRPISNHEKNTPDMRNRYRFLLLIEPVDIESDQRDVIVVPHTAGCETLLVQLGDEFDAIVMFDLRDDSTCEFELSIICSVSESDKLRISCSYLPRCTLLSRQRNSRRLVSDLIVAILGRNIPPSTDAAKRTRLLPMVLRFEGYQK